ncbi:MAG TPA: cyclic dehypoxanthinyl futalosine synthase [Armatimonadota bacterium]|nr:cyclic dehypoxanthinyl futalosine synthase [Armatimonadota bacterium]
MNAAGRILSKAVEGARISAEEAVRLFEGVELPELGLAADAVCRRLHPEPFRTYVVDRNINYTNICVSKCRFCAFYRAADSPEAYLLSSEEIHEKIAEAVGLGATQILMQGGLHPDLDISYYERMVRGIRERFKVHVHSFSPPEIVHVARVSGLTIGDAIARLKAAGLDSIPGGGAEILTDACRSGLSPSKCTTQEWLDVMETAHRLGVPTTATMMFGHIESFADRVEHLIRIRELQERTGGFTAFIPWTFQPANTKLGGEAVGGYDYLRTLAISRLVLDNFRNIQASWVTQGAKIGQVALYFGANDLGSTMIEENVVAAAGVSFHMSEEELRQAITEAGYTPCRRDTCYRVLEYVVDSPRRREEH